MIEIERKFLVNSDVFIKEAFNNYTIKQGFLNRHEKRTVRVRLKKDKGYLTVKGKSSENGLVRFEWEKEIPLKEAEDLLSLCEEGVIIKKRYLINSGIHTFEVDVFEGENLGLTIAEIELNAAEETFIKPLLMIGMVFSQ